MSTDEPIIRHLEAIDAGRDIARLLAFAGAPEVSRPAAREWVRRWPPTPMNVQAPGCGCRVGRCTVCN